MNVAFLKAVAALVPAGIILCGSAILFFREKAMPNLLQLIGASSLVLVALAHLCEALQLFPSMLWGYPDSVGHDLDLFSAVLGLVLFPVGYLFNISRFQYKRSGALGLLFSVPRGTVDKGPLAFRALPGEDICQSRH